MTEDRAAEARRVELAVGQCEALSILPSSAARFLTQLGRMELTPSLLSELIESDPALTILVLRLCRDKKIAITQPDYWILQALEGLSLREIRDAMLSARIYGLSAAALAKTEGLSEEPRADFRKELTRHSLAVGCCAEQLAQFVTPALESHTAYLAGLLHDTGKFLLDEAMPKSFDILLEQARTGKTSLWRVEQANLGLDHAILGKRFAQKLRLPSDIILGIWLHHNQTGAVSQVMPQARIAAVVELADCIVRRAGIGESGTYDEEVSAETIAGSLGLGDEQIKKVTQQLPEIVQQKSEAIGLAILRPGWAYCDSLRAMAGQLAGESTKLFDESSRLQSSASHFDFVREMLAKLNSHTSAIEMAGEFALIWQRFYHTGPVCVYLVGATEAKVVEAAIVENQGKVKALILDVPAGAKLIPPASTRSPLGEAEGPLVGRGGQPVREKFAVVDVADYADWLFEQLDVEFDRTRTRMAPLVSDGKTVGIIVFELRHPAEGDISERFAPAARLGGVLLDMLEAIGSQQWYAERFAQLLSGQRSADSVQRTAFSGQRTAFSEQLAEMAAGAAHELNNPLSVIRGRAQLLAGSESDPDKKRVLEQIQQNTRELSAIIDDLMSYANPPAPRPTETAVRQIIDEAIDLSGRKAPLRRSDIKVDISPDTPKVLVDSAQVAIALSNIICNALESYDGQTPDKDIRGQAGPLTIQVSCEKSKPAVTIVVIDSGRGMDEQTLAKATQPFFSAKPAGRKRGMGLAHAQRLIEINNGTLTLSSQPGKGTVVTVVLPSR